MFRDWLHTTLTRLYPSHLFDVLVPPDTSMGDYSVNLAFKLANLPARLAEAPAKRAGKAGSEKKNPREVARSICNQLVAEGGDMIERCEVAGPGFVNMYLKEEYLYKTLDGVGITNEGKGAKVIVEYSAPNIAKPMSVGHLRSTIIGDGLARVYRALGYDVVRWNYIGDWGTQFGKLIAAYRRYDGQTQELTVANLVAMYVRFHAEEAENPELEKLGQEEFKKLEAGDTENRALWEKFREESLNEFQRMYARLGVQFDVIKGESDYQDVLPDIVASLKPLLTSSEGAQVIMLDDYGLPPALIQKTDGSSIYMVRDVASLRDRIEQYHPAKILYVVGNEQSLHFEQLFVIKDKMKLGATDTVHVKFGMVLGDDGKKFSTRKGNVVLLDDLMNEIISRAEVIVRSKNPLLSEEEIRTTAEAVGVGALKYNDLRQHPHSDIVFDWDAMLDLGGNSGPYIQYTYARLSNITSKVGKVGTADRTLLVHPAERALMRHLLDFGYAIETCANLYTLNALALYCYELAEIGNRFYEQVRINDDDNDARKSARLELIGAVTKTLKAGLNILGIQTLERI